MELDELTEDELYAERNKLQKALKFGTWRFGERCGEQPELLRRLRAVESQLNIVRFGEDVLY